MANTPPIAPGVAPVQVAPSAVGSQQLPPLPPLLPGTVITGQVVGADSSGNPVLEAVGLRIVLRTQYHLTKGTEVALRLDAPLTSDKPEVRIVSVGGKPIQTMPATQSSHPLTQPLNSALQDLGTSKPAAVPLQQAANAAVPEVAAKPVGVLLEITRLPAQATKSAEAPILNSPIVDTRQIAAEVAVGTETYDMTALLVRPSAQATDQLQHLLRALPQSAIIQPPLTEAAPALLQALPGLEIHVKLLALQLAPAPSGVMAASVTISPAASLQPTQQAVPAAGEISLPIASPAQATLAPAIVTPPSPPINAQLRTAYQAYGMTPTAPIPTVAAPVAPPLPTLSSPAVTPTLLATPIATTVTVNTPATSPSIPPVAMASPQAHISNPAQLATPTQFFTPQHVEQLLARAEAQNSAPNQIPAVVLGHEKSGSLIVQTRMGVFTMPSPSPNEPLPVGSVLQWEVRSVRPTTASDAAIPLPATPGSTLANASSAIGTWPALAELSGLLQGMHTSSAAQMLQQIIPHIGNQFSAGLLFFMSVLRKGDVTQWLGKDLIQELERMGKGELVQRLAHDLTSLRPLFAEASNPNWQALFFPVMADNELHQARLFVKRDADEKKKGGSGTRFVVELELSQLGPMQFDGLIKRREQQTFFELVIRSIFGLAEDIKRDISGIFTNAQEVTGIKGALHFKTVPQFPVNPLEEMVQTGTPNSILA